ncbi:MAG: nuclear transport factor 2 family protein [Sphingobacteriales bacterium]|nr:nuclear transport factor 2 family protein [Sphingobacteriales bacterium]MBI3717977.1 nuclear transport factor 2 family protein [Sphingobacteriales bacterium]
MKKILIACFISCIFPLLSHSQSAAETEIRTTMSNQVKYWNEGNLEAFMQGYWKSDSVMFIGSHGITYGWQNTLNSYKKGYPDTAAMGKLNFNLLEVKRLSAIYFFVTGKWHLTRSIGDAEGYFTLLFQKIKNKWVIVKDHSS